MNLAASRMAGQAFDLPSLLAQAKNWSQKGP
jgi:hypothetical protein